MLLIAWAACVPAAADEDSCFLFLRHLARHQLKDGSWGGRPGGCTCPHPPDPPPAAADPEFLRGLVGQLGDDDPEQRDAAERGLRSLVEEALPALQEGSAHSDAEVSSRCERIRFDIGNRSRGAGDVETTGLAVLAFLGAGYSHLSRDTYEGHCFGTVVWNGLQWLMARQDANGRFQANDAVANAVAALALSEAYGLTASGRFQDAAQRGVTAVEEAEAREPRELVWKALVLASAQLSEFKGAHAGQAVTVEKELGKHGSILAGSGRAFVRFSFRKEQDAWTDEIARTAPKGMDPETRWLAAMALFAQEGHKGARWQGWNPALKESIVPGQLTKKACERGSWGGDGTVERLRKTALNGLALEVYYRYGSMFILTQ